MLRHHLHLIFALLVTGCVGSQVSHVTPSARSPLPAVSLGSASHAKLTESCARQLSLIATGEDRGVGGRAADETIDELLHSEAFLDRVAPGTAMGTSVLSR